jgi:hypothetical protein
MKDTSRKIFWRHFEKLSCSFISQTIGYIYYTIYKDEFESRIRWYLCEEIYSYYQVYFLPDLKSKSIFDLKQTGDYLLFITEENNEFDFFARVSSFFIFFPKSKIFSTVFKKLI